MVAHHGSRGSSDAAFVAATGRAIALVSTGHGNRFRHPHPDALARWRAPWRRGRRHQPAAARCVSACRRPGPCSNSAAHAQPRLWDAVRRQERAGWAILSA